MPDFVLPRDPLLRTNSIVDSPPPLTIISGGQTGVDRAALDVAIERGIPHGGWCPRGRRAEDGPLATHYVLKESPTREYSERTFLNIRNSDGTLILHREVLAGGTLLTHQLATRIHVPLLVIQVEEVSHTRSIDSLSCWLQDNSIQVLNVAGPRESGDPGIYHQAGEFLRTFLSRRA